ncbi:MATE family efflux transporter [Solimonas terrae]|uniref:Multidrug-efflux transporter n=1 Tax=Solimonas terrae TaxID=1396819 RepID=A0A6M2BWJ3_9GAMM|nr:MATE family efflux transporter [Solimonas terrae]NGY06349.1 MATE family efflux transporter [Solimonas terrae]
MAARDLTSGSIGAHLLRMAAFMLLTMFVQTLYSLIDIFWVGHLGRDAVAAVALGSNLMLALMAVSQSLAVGAAALISQAAGRKDFDEARRLFTQSQSLAILLALVFFVLMYGVRGLYSDALAGNAEVARLTRDFLLPFIPAMALQIPLFVLSAALRGVGDVRTASIAQVASVLVNIVLAPVLIFGWGSGHPLGVVGASLATLISVLAGVFGLAIHVVRRTRFLLAGPGAWKPQVRIWLRMVRIGLPSGLEMGLMAFYMGFVMAMLQRFGSAPQAAFGVGMRVLQVGMMPAMAVTFSSAAIVGQNYGARRPARVRATFAHAVKLNLTAAGFFCLAFHLAPTMLIGLFSNDSQVQYYGAQFLRWISWNLMAMVAVMACGGVFSGLGNTLPSLAGSVVRIGFITVFALLLSTHPGFAPHWIWALSVVASLLQLAINLPLLRREMRRRLRPMETAAV